MPQVTIGRCVAIAVSAQTTTNKTYVTPHTPLLKACRSEERGGFHSSDLAQCRPSRRARWLTGGEDRSGEDRMQDGYAQNHRRTSET